MDFVNVESNDVALFFQLLQGIIWTCSLQYFQTVKDWSVLGYIGLEYIGWKDQKFRLLSCVIWWVPQYSAAVQDCFEKPGSKENVPMVDEWTQHELEEDRKSDPKMPELISTGCFMPSNVEKRPLCGRLARSWKHCASCFMTLQIDRKITQNWLTAWRFHRSFVHIIG